MIKCNAHHRRKPQVTYKLKIWELSTDGKAVELCKRLKTAFTESMDWQDQLQELQDVVKNYEGERRLSARLWQRADRERVEEDAVLNEDQQKTKEEIRSTTYDLLGALKKRSEDFSTDWLYFEGCWPSAWTKFEGC